MQTDDHVRLGQQTDDHVMASITIDTSTALESLHLVPHSQTKECAWILLQARDRSSGAKTKVG